MRGAPKVPDENLIRMVAAMFEERYRGRERKVTKQVLAESLNVNTRLIELSVFALRQQLAPILADGEGYWWSTDPAEFEPVLRSLTHRLGQIHMTLRALEFARTRLLRQVRTEPNGQGRLVFQEGVGP